MDFKKTIKELRQNNNISQKKLAEIVECSQSIICDYENGKSEPSLLMLKKISKYFNVSIDYLVGNANEEGMIIMQNELSEDENYLIDLVRQLDMKDKSTIYELTELMVQAKKNKTK